jgi:hypothetical protein
MSTPHPLLDVLHVLWTAAEHLLSMHDCDCSGYERISVAADAARRLEGNLRAALAAAPAPAGGLLELLAEAENRRLKVLQERDDGIAHAGIARGRLDELDWLLKQLPSVCRQGRVYEPGRRG